MSTHGHTHTGRLIDRVGGAGDSRTAAPALPASPRRPERVTTPAGAPEPPEDPVRGWDRACPDPALPHDASEVKVETGAGARPPELSPCMEPWREESSASPPAVLEWVEPRRLPAPSEAGGGGGWEGLGGGREQGGGGEIESSKAK